jgi:hypothetical protein
MTNGEFLWNITHSIVQHNKVPFTIGMWDCHCNQIDIEIQEVNDHADEILYRAVIKDDAVAIADLGYDGLVVPLDDDWNDWLNDEVITF